MKKSKLLSGLDNFFNPEHKRTKHYAKELKAVLRKLRKKERELTEALEQTNDQERVKLYQTELEIIRIHRKKGVTALRTLRGDGKQRKNLDRRPGKTTGDT